MKTLLLYSAFIILSLNSVLAQITVSGKILDKETNKNVDFVAISVKSKNIGIYTDSLGKFILKNCDDNDTLIIKHISYKKELIPITYFSQDSVFFITPEPIILKEVVVKPQKTKEYKVGYTNGNSNSSLRSFKGYEVATLIENDKKIENSHIKEIVLYVKKEKEISFYIRTHIYTNENNRPGCEIKYDNLHLLKNKKGIIKIDISNYMIPFPVNGLFIGVEWVGMEPEKKIKEESISPKLLITDKQTKNITYYRFWDLPWIDLSSLFGKPKVNALIGLTIIE